MRLASATIRNYRSIKHVEIDFDPACRVLVGINESGKSNILRALSLLDSTVTVSIADVREFPPEENPESEAFVRFVFTTEKSERMTALEHLYGRVLGDDVSLPIIKVHGELLTLAEFVDSQMEILWSVNIRTGKRGWTGWALPPKSQTVSGWHRPSTIGEDVELFVDGEEVRLGNYRLIPSDAHTAVLKEHLVDISAEYLRSLVSQAIVDVVKGEKPACVFWAYDESNLLPGQIDIDEFAADPDVCTPLKHMFVLAGHNDIATTLSTAQKRTNGLRNVLKRVAEVGTAHMHSVWSDYKGIRINLQPNGSNIDAGIEDTHNLYDFSRRSDGFKRFISFLLTVSTQVKMDELKNVLYLHDEPDSSLHPSGARYLREELVRISEKNYVVYSTHSIFMIDREIIGRHLIVRKENEVTQVEQVNASNIVDEEVVYNALGYSVFESLRSQNIVFEGWRDKKIFQVALTRVPAKHRKEKTQLSKVGVCHAKGVKDIGRVTPLLELADRGCVILSDSDQVAIEHQRQYDGYGTWYRYDELLPDTRPLTGEDFVKPEVLSREMERIRAKHPTLSEVRLADLQVERGRIEVIQRWLQVGVADRNLVKTIMNEIKECVFNELRPTQIEESYYELLSALAKRMR